jgi:hypothetical protein
MLQQLGMGFGAVALSGILGTEAQSGEQADNETADNETAGAPAPFAVRQSHFPAKAKSIIYLYMDGGPSQVDTFDPKPTLKKFNGQPFQMRIEPTQFDNIGKTLASPWEFSQHGESGIPVSSLFPHMAKHVDEMAVIRSMTSNFSEHTNGNYFLHTGSGQQGRPSMGAWFGYGLGSECQDLPAFVVLNGGLVPPGGLDNFNSGFLPATYQASIFQPGDELIANVRPSDKGKVQRKKLDILRQLDQDTLRQIGPADPIESAIANYELAFRMQSAVPALADLSGESKSTQEMYGLESKVNGTATFGRQCLLARRLVERGVRFIELTCPGVGHDRWDQHQNLVKGHTDNALAVDQGIGALLTDLKQRDLLKDTLVVWSGEFGRTPFAQGNNGRDHNPWGFSLWMAGGGIRGGTIYGATDDFGYKAVENKAQIHDLHATMLHLLGMDHKRLTYRFSGRDMRLTDVHGEVIHDIIA